MIYIRKTPSTSSQFQGRSIQIVSDSEKTVIPVPDTVVLCNGCNENVYPDDGYLVYLDKHELEAGRPYDFYCEKCTERFFPGCCIVE